MSQPTNPRSPLSTEAGHRRISGSRRRGLLMLAGAAMFFSPLFLMRASATATSTAQVEFVHPGEGGSPGYSDTGKYSASAGGADSRANNFYIGNGTAALTSNGPADLPDLHATAEADPGNPEGVTSTATFGEGLLTFIYTGAVTNSVLTFNFNVSGTLTGDATAFLTLSFGTFNDTVALTSGFNPISIVVPTSALNASPSGNDLEAGYQEQLTVGGNNIASNGGSTGTSTANFSDTVQLTSIDATDGNGNPIAGTFTDGDQISFAANTTLTPEPSTTALLASSALLLAFLMKRRLRAT